MISKTLDNRVIVNSLKAEEIIGTGSGLLVDEKTADQVQSGDHERFAHYVKKDKIVESAVLGGAVVALCGKVWVPTRDPGKFPVCPECKEIFEGLPPGSENNQDS